VGGGRLVVVGDCAASSCTLLWCGRHSHRTAKTLNILAWTPHVFHSAARGARGQLLHVQLSVFVDPIQPFVQGLYTVVLHVHGYIAGAHESSLMRIKK
jgi:hypothetical protein